MLAKFKKIISEFDDSVYMDGMKGGQSGGNRNRGPSKSEKEEARVRII